MRKLAALLFLALPLAAATAQHNPAETNWLRVQALTPGRSVTLRTAGHKTHCHFVSADADSILCAKGSSKAPETYQRTDIALVQTDNRAKSTLLGLGIGTAGGAAFGAAIGRNGSFIPRGPAAVALGAVGAVIGTIIGATGNFAHTTVYRAP